MNTIPQEMNVLEIDRYYDDSFEAIRHLHVTRRPVPKPVHGQVLVKVAASPCNPSDLLLLQGRYGRLKTLPAVPGWEGSGTVVATGGGLMARWLLGKRVAFTAQDDAIGSWAQYTTVDANTCIALKEGVSFEQGAALIINPLTAVGMVETAVKEGHAAIIQTAAASQVGRMVLALANERGIPVIHIVRRKDQEELLRSLGGHIILNSESKTFEKDLQNEAKKLKATMAFEAVAGPMTGLILKAMPPKSKVLVYGALSGIPCADISPLGLIFQEKIVAGFFLYSWITQLSFWGRYQVTNSVQRLLAKGTFHTAIHAKVPLEQASAALEAYQKEMTTGKVLIIPNSEK